MLLNGRFYTAVALAGICSTAVFAATLERDSAIAKKAQADEAKKYGLEVQRTIRVGNGTTITFALIPSGEFLMGASKPTDRTVPKPDFAPLVRQRGVARVLLIVGGIILLSMLFKVSVNSWKTRKIQYSLVQFTVGAISIAIIGYGYSMGRDANIQGAAMLEEFHSEIKRVEHEQAVQDLYFSQSMQQERPAHLVTISTPFYMSITEVTQEQYESVTGVNPSHFKDASRPVEQLSFNDAMAFCSKISRELKIDVRLPTEAEWECAARAGTNAPFSFTSDNLLREIWCYYPGRKGTNRAGSLRSNGFGLFDMHGNVAEWCGDWYAPYTDASVIDPVGSDSGVEKVMRGGGWESVLASCSNSARIGIDPNTRNWGLGLRLVIVPVEAHK